MAASQNILIRTETHCHRPAAPSFAADTCMNGQACSHCSRVFPGNPRAVCDGGLFAAPTGLAVIRGQGLPTMRSGSTARSLIRIGACGRSWKCSDPIGCIQSFHALLRQRNCCRRSTTRTSRPDRMAAGLMRQMRAVDRFQSRFQPASCII